MPFSAGQAPAAIARALAQIADRPHDLVDAFLERSEEILLAPSEVASALEVRREKGLAVRLMRDGRSWLGSRDRLDGAAFAEAVRQVARVLPRSELSPPVFDQEPWSEAPQAPEVWRFPGELERQIRSHHVAFPYRLWVQRYERHLQVIGPELVAEPESELFYSVRVESSWGRHGTLLPELGPAAAAGLARSLVGLFKAREAAPPRQGTGVLVLGPSATAVLLHEAVAHALEADVATVQGDPEQLLGRALGSDRLDVLDDPAGAPEGVARRTDDEGTPVLRRWLLRSGVVEQLLADRRWAAGSPRLAAGAARRAHRHAAPSPRSSHLELVAGPSSREQLLEDAVGGLWLPEVAAGRLDPVSGEVRLHFPGGRRLGRNGLEESVGPCTLVAPLGRLLESVTGVGSERAKGGAGWCAKDGLKIPVWATAPALRLEGLELEG